MKTKFLWAAALALSLVACGDDDEGMSIAPPVVIQSGSADFTNYVALGNSLTAGYTDGALFQAGQINSFPNIMAKSMKMASSSLEFKQPMTSDNIGGLLLGGTQIADPRLYFDGSGPTQLMGTPTTEITQTLTGSFNNMGIPGAAVQHLLAPGYGSVAGVATGTANPYFVRFASSPTASVVGDAVAQNPTFFSLWIGNNDVLGYALAGGAGSASITDLPTFTGAYNAIVAQLTGDGAKGVVANIPDVTSIAHFTTVPYNPLDATIDPDDPTVNAEFRGQIPTLNAVYGALKPIFIGLGHEDRVIEFKDGESNPVVVWDEGLTNIGPQIQAALSASPEFAAFVQNFGLSPASVPIVASYFGAAYGQARQATEKDLLVLPSKNIIGKPDASHVATLMGMGLPQALAGQFAVVGVTLPMYDNWVLVPSEIKEITDATKAYNTVIEAAATDKGLALVDANKLMEDLADGGIRFDNFLLTSQLVLGGAFSLDGVHLTARGSALVANKFMEQIDATYGSNLMDAAAKAGDFGTGYSPTLK